MFLLVFVGLVCGSIQLEGPLAGEKVPPRLSVNAAAVRLRVIDNNPEICFGDQPGNVGATRIQLLICKHYYV